MLPWVPWRWALSGPTLVFCPVSPAVSVLSMTEASTPRHSGSRLLSTSWQVAEFKKKTASCPHTPYFSTHEASLSVVSREHPGTQFASESFFTLHRQLLLSNGQIWFVPTRICVFEVELVRGWRTLSAGLRIADSTWSQGWVGSWAHSPRWAKVRGILSSQQDWTPSTTRPSRSHVAVSQRGSWYLSSSSRESVSGVTDHSWPRCSLFLSPASRCNVSLKKQRSRGILSSFFCCFRDYNVEAPPGSGPGVLPPLVEENGGLQKVSTNAPLPPRGLCPIPDEHP